VPALVAAWPPPAPATTVGSFPAARGACDTAAGRTGVGGCTVAADVTVAVGEGEGEGEVEPAEGCRVAWRSCAPEPPDGARAGGDAVSTVATAGASGVGGGGGAVAGGGAPGVDVGGSVEVGVGDGVGVAVAVGDSVAVGDGVGVNVGVSVEVGAGEGVAVGVAVGGWGVAVAVGGWGVGVGVGVAATISREATRRTASGPAVVRVRCLNSVKRILSLAEPRGEPPRAEALGFASRVVFRVTPGGQNRDIPY